MPTQQGDQDRRDRAEVGVAWQFTAEDQAVLAAGFGELAALSGSKSRLRL
jgi:hypothetical protein